MPKRTTTAALSVLTNNNQGEVVIRLNAKAAPGSSIVESSVDWGDEEVEEVIESLPTNADHAYMSAGERLIILSVKDSKGKVVSEGINVLVVKEIEPIPPEPEPKVEITKLVPESGPRGSNVEIQGTNFGPIQDTSTLKMDDVSMVIKSWSDTKIVAVIP